MSYAVRIEAFEGPLDLLLYLIRRNEMEIYDIPIAEITRQYLDYIDVLQMLDLEVAGDFLVMAATLMQIKARLLLPTGPGVEADEDPRAELVRQLEEYRLYKQAAETLAGRETEYAEYFLRRDGPGPFDPPQEEEILLDVSLFDLLQAFQQAVQRLREEGRQIVAFPEVRIEQQIALLRQRLAERGSVSFQVLLRELENRLTMVVTLVAVLEMARVGELTIRQPDLYGEIWLDALRPAATLTPETEP